MDAQQFEIEARQLRPRLLALATRYMGDADEAEDVVQETLLKLWFIRDRWEQYRSPEALAVVMAKHICLNTLRGRKEMEHNIEHLQLPDESDSEALAEAEEDEQTLRFLIRDLPDTQQAVLRMKHLEGMEVNEIATLTGSNAVAVRANLSRARKRIKEEFIKLKGIKR